jgi:hypothetical protein
LFTYKSCNYGIRSETTKVVCFKTRYYWFLVPEAARYFFHHHGAKIQHQTFSTSNSFLLSKTKTSWISI